MEMVKRIEVKMLVWEGNVLPYEMEDIIDDVRLPFMDLLEDMTDIKNYHFHFSYFDSDKPFTEAVKETVKEIYNENKNYKFLEMGICFRKEIKL